METIYKPITVFVGYDNGVLYSKIGRAPENFITYDFPENYRHPWKHVESIEILCRNWNKHHEKVAMCTHSPYIIDHLVNLMFGYKAKDKAKAAKLLRLKDPDSFIDQKDVAVYFIGDDGGIKNILEEDGFINWESLSEVSEYVSQVMWDIQEE